MDVINCKELEWKLIAEENGKQILSYDCPTNAVQSIIETIVKSSMGENSSPEKNVLKVLKQQLNENVISDEIVIKLTGIDKDQLQGLLRGNKASLNTDHLFKLTKLVSINI